MPNPHTQREQSARCGAFHRPSQGDIPRAVGLAKLARHQFWAARNVGDRRAMVFWSAREHDLRRTAHGLAIVVPLPARTRTMA